ncbi:hypothetical protein Tco_1023818, partial [Tanacetum coccineum]
FFADTEDENDGLNPTLQYEWILTFKTEKQTRTLIRRTRWRQSNEDNKLLKSTHRISSSWIAKATSISCAFLTFMKAQLIEIAIKNGFVGIFVHLAVIVKIENLPLTLESEEHYFASFVYPLLEETRADLASSMEIMYRAPFAKKFHWLKASKRKEMVNEGKHILSRLRTCKSMIGKLIDGEAKASKQYTLNLLVHEEIECDAQGVWN